MANFFDQFDDLSGGNFFDQFDDKTDEQDQIKGGEEEAPQRASGRGFDSMMSEDARAARGFGRSAYMSGLVDEPAAAAPTVGIGTIDEQGDQRPLTDAQEEIVAAREERRARGADLGSRFMRGATEVAASVPEAAAIAGAGNPNAAALFAQEEIERANEQIRLAEDRLADLPAGSDARKRIEEVIAAEKKKIAAYDPLVSIAQGPLKPAAQDRDLFKVGADVRKMSLDTFGTPNPEYDDRFLSKLSEGAGSMLGFVVATLGTGVIGGATMGASASSSEMYRRAIQEGATEEQAKEAAFWGGIIGTTEVLPIGRAFNKLPQGLKSKAKSAFARRFMNGLRGGVEESIQEVSSDVMKNMVEAGVWDPDQEIFTEDLPETALISFILGGGMGVIAPPPPRQPDINDYRKPTDAGSPLADLAAEGRMILDSPPITPSGIQPGPEGRAAPAAPGAPAAGVAPEVGPIIQPLGKPETGAAPQQPAQPESDWEVTPEIDRDEDTGQVTETGRVFRHNKKTGERQLLTEQEAAIARTAPEQVAVPEADRAPLASATPEATATATERRQEAQVTQEAPQAPEEAAAAPVEAPAEAAPKPEIGDEGFEVTMPEQDRGPDLTIDQRATLETGELPADLGPDAYLFKTKDSQTVPLDKITPIRARPEGIANAKPLIAQAALKGARRQPLSVKQNADGTYTLLDGNSTYAVLSSAGVKNAEVRVLTEEQFDADQQRDGVRKIYKNPTKKLRRVDTSKLGTQEGKMAVRVLSTKQPFNTVEEAVGTPQQQADQDELNASLRIVATGIGYDYKDAPAKGIERARQKVNGKYGGKATFLTDTVRGTIEVKSVAEGDAVVDALAEQYTVVDEGYVTTELGYVDRKVGVLLPSGRWAEVHILPPGVLQVKQAEGHKLYETWRDDRKPEAERTRAKQQSQQMYGLAMTSADPSWRQMFQVSEAPVSEASAPAMPATPASKAASVISGERSSAKISERSTGQVSEPENMVAEPSSSMRTKPMSVEKKRGIGEPPSVSTTNINTQDYKSQPLRIKNRAQFEQFVAVLEERLKKMMIRNVPLRFEQDLPGRGATEISPDNAMAIIIGQTSDAMNTLNHEAIHVLNQLGLFTKAEWDVLSKEADRFWLKQYRIADDEIYSQLDKETQREEAIAQAFADFISGKKPASTAVQKIFAKMRRFFNAVRQAMGATNINSVEDIFDRVDRGEVGMRGAAPQQAHPGRAGDETERLYQSKELRAGSEDLAGYGVEPKKKYKTREIAAALQARARERYGKIARNDRSPEAVDKISNWMADEVMYEVETSVANGNSAVGWYSSKYQNALDEFSTQFPELDQAATDMRGTVFNSPQQARDYFTALVAITSDGEKVYTNFKRAAQLYGEARKTGVIPEDTKATRGISMQTNAKIINQLWAEHGDKFREYLLAEFTVSDINAHVRELNAGRSKSDQLPLAQYPADRTLPRAAILFEPKLGAFYANLSGSEGYLTMDRWWTRTFNRYRGDLITAPTKQGMDNLRIQILADRRGLRPMPDTRSQTQRKDWISKTKELLKPEEIQAMTDDQVLSTATDLAAGYAAKGYKNGTSLERAANTVYKAAFEGIEDQPFNTKDRGFMIDAVTEAQRKLAQDGVSMSIADIQAILWYYEKRLYAEMGARATPDVSYEEVAKRIVEESRDGRGPAGRAGVEAVGGREAADGGADFASVRPGEDQLAGESAGRSRVLYQRAGGEEVRGRQDRRGAVDVLAPVSEEDFRQLETGTIPDQFFDRPGWAVLGATQDWGDSRFGEQHNARATEQLPQDLERMEIPYIEQTGFYKGEPDGVSFLILSDRRAAEMLGKRYKQESILTNQGLIYTSRPQAATPLTGGFVTGTAATEQDFYSSMRGGLSYALELDTSTGAGVPIYPEGYQMAYDRPQLPVNEKGNVELHHWGPEGLKKVDPEYAGTGPLKGAERAAGQKLSFFGINPRQSQTDPGTGYVKEPGLPSTEYVAEVKPDRLYPWFEDPDGFDGRLTGDTPAARRNEKIKMIRDAGYIGYYVTDDGSMRAPLGNVASLFKPVPVKPAPRRLYQRQQYRKAPVPNQPFIPDRRMWEEIHNATGLWAKWDGAKGALMDQFDKARVTIQDRFLPILRAQEIIERESGQQLPDWMNVYENEATYSGRVGRHLRVINDDFVAPIVQTIADTKGMTVDSVGDYLYAKHAIERNNYLEAMDEQSQDDLSGMTDAEAQAIIDKAENGPSATEYKQIADLVYMMNDNAVQMRVDAGLMTQQDADVWRNQYKHYVPLRGFAETDHYDMQLGASGVYSRYSVSGAESKRALGRKSRAFNPLQGAVTQAQEVAIRAEKNMVGQALYNLVEQFPSENMWEIKDVEMRRYINKRTGLIETRAVSPLQTRIGENEMAVKIDGKEKRIVFKDPRLAQAAGTINANKMNFVLRMLSGFSRYFSAVTTMLDPSFVVRNAFRDFVTAQINIKAFGGEDAKAIQKAMMRDWFKSMRTVYKGQGSLAVTNQEMKWYKEFEESGAKVWFWTLQPAEEAVETLNQQVKLRSGNGLSRMAKLLSSPSSLVTIDHNPILGKIEQVNLAVDNAIRFAAYKEARRRGWSKQKAANLSKDLTVNFNRRGTLTPVLNGMYPFFNAAVQGTQILFRAMQNKQVARTVMGLVALGIVEDMVNSYNSEEDEDGELAYDKIPNYKLEMSAVVMTGDGAITMPLPYGYNVFPYMGKQIGKMMRGVKSPGDAMGDTAAAAFAAFSPMFMDDSDNAGDNFIKMISPTALDPLVEVALNKDWLGRKIVPRNAYGDYGPDAYKYYNGVSDISLAISDMMNRATGGNKAKSGMIDISPEVIDHLFQFGSGGAGRFTSRVVETTANLLTGDIEAIETYRVPIARQLYTSTGTYNDINRYYDFRERVKAAKEAVEAARDAGERARPEDYNLDKLRNSLKLADKQMRAIRKEKKAVGRAATTEQRNKWREREGRVALTFNKKFVDIMGRQAE